MKFINSEEYSRIIRKNERTVRRWAETGKIPGAIKKGKLWLIPDPNNLTCPIPDIFAGKSVILRTKVSDTGHFTESQVVTPADTVIIHWNKHEIIVHQKSESLISKVASHLKRKKEYKLSDILTAIDNYAMILKGDYFFKYKWTLVEFLGRENALKFYGENFVEENFRNKDRASQSSDRLQKMIENNPFRKRMNNEQSA